MDWVCHYWGIATRAVRSFSTKRGPSPTAGEMPSLRQLGKLGNYMQMTTDCFVEEHTNEAHLILDIRLTHETCLHWIIPMISKPLMVEVAV